MDKLWEGMKDAFSEGLKVTAFIGGLLVGVASIFGLFASVLFAFGVSPWFALGILPCVLIAGYAVKLVSQS